MNALVARDRPDPGIAVSKRSSLVMKRSGLLTIRGIVKLLMRGARNQKGDICRSRSDQQYLLH